MHDAVCEAVVVDGFVEGGAIVPECDGVGFPAKAAGVFGLCDVVVEEVEEAFVFAWWEADDVGGEESVDEDGFAFGDGVCADEGVCDGRVCLKHGLEAFGATGFGEAFAEAVAEVMHGVEVIEESFHGGGEAFVGGDEAGPHGVTADFGDDLGVEDRAEGRLGSKGHIGVPRFDLGGFFGGVFEDGDFGEAVGVWVGFVDLECAKAFAESLVLGGGDVLASKEEDEMFAECVMEPGKGIVIKGLCEVDVVYFCAECASDGFDGKSLAWHGLILASIVVGKSRQLGENKKGLEPIW